MTVPTVATYSIAAYIAAHSGLLSEIDGAASAGKVFIRDAADVLLATIILDDPSGTVSGTTGVLSIAETAQVLAVLDGMAAYAELTDGDDNLLLSLPAVAGVVPVSGYAVLNTLSIKSNQVVGIVSMTIG